MIIHFGKKEWFADYAALAWFYTAIDHWFARLCEIGLPCSFIPEPSKNILITHTDIIASATDFFEHYNFEIKAGNRFLGDFLGEKALAQEYTLEKVANWATSVGTFSDLMGQQPQCKWAYLQQSLELAGDTFDPLEEAIHMRLLPALSELPEAPQGLRDLAELPVRHSGLGALNPTKEAPRNRATFVECTAHLWDATLDLC
eukprot:13847707-Ditylum_brightwellii.AAC.1